jgi:Tol biopolymer transport system component/DNA-binding winged helix-turn-helix (wHTH) protein
MMSREARPSYEFGPFRLDLSEHVLLRDGHPVPLTPKVFEVLRVLVQNAGHLVEKDTLLKEVWPDSFVEEGALNRNVSILRKVLGDGASGQKYIETAPKFGYRFVASVTERLNDSSPPIVEPESRSVVDIAPIPAVSRSLANPPPPPRAVRADLTKRASAIAGAFLIVAALAYAVVRPDAPEKEAPPPLAPAHRQVTFTGKEGYATLSPDGRRIAYVSDEAPEKKVVVQELAGGQPLTVFSAPEVGHLRWSPDGSDLLMWTRGSVPNGVYIMPQLGGTPRRIAAGQYMACWSPDGSTIVVGSYLGGKLWFVNKLGQELRTVSVQGVRGSIWDMDWSPANGLLMFVSDDLQGRYTISTVRPDGTDHKRVLVENTQIPSARWAPRGDAIYYFRRLNQTVSLHKIVQPGHQDREADTTTLITGLETDRTFALSADAKRLVYARAPYHSNLWMLDVGGPGNNHRSETKELTRGTSRIERARVSPDGTSIVFNIGHEPRTELYTLPMTGGSPKQLTFLDAFSVGGVWSADGKTIAFGSTRGGKPQVWIVEAGGGIPRALSSGDLSDSLDLAWSPGSQILYQQAGNRNYYELDPETRKERPFSRDSSVGWMFSPVYSPDGRKIAVFWNRPPNRGLLVIDTRARRETLVYKTSAGSSTPIGWSADGRSIYLVEGKNSTGRDLALRLGETTAEAKILMVPVDGGEVTTVASVPFEEIGGVSMTPDGRRFVFTVYSSRSDVWVVDNFDVPSGARTVRK